MSRGGAALRKAFHLATLGRHVSVAITRWPDVKEGAAEGKLSRAIGDKADLRPDFELMDIILELCPPDAILNYITQRTGTRWEWLPEAKSRQLQQMRESLDGMREQIEMFSEVLGTVEPTPDRSSMLRVRHREKQKRGTG